MKDNKDVEADPDVRTLAVKKINYGQTGNEVKLRWEEGIFVPDTGIKTAYQMTAAAERADAAFLALLRTYNSEGRSVSPKPSNAYAPTVFAKDQRAGGITKEAFGDSMNRLFGAGLIHAEKIGPPSRQTLSLLIKGVS